MAEERTSKFERSADRTLEFTQIIDTGNYSNDQIRIKFADNNILSVWAEEGTSPLSQVCLRRLQLPLGVDASNIKTFYTNDRKLVIRAPVTVTSPTIVLTDEHATPRSVSPFIPRDGYRSPFLETRTLKSPTPRLNFTSPTPWMNEVYTLPKTLSSRHFEEILHLNPKFKPNDVHISVDKGMICVEAEYRGEITDLASLGKETPSIEKYKKRFPIPEEYDIDKMTAKFNNGTLHIVAPLKNEDLIPNSETHFRPVKPSICDSLTSDLENRSFPRTATLQSSSPLSSTYREEITLDSLFTPENIEISFHGSDVVIKGRVNRMNHSTGQIHSTHNYRHEIHIPNTVDVLNLSARWIGTNKILLEAPMRSSISEVFPKFSIAPHSYVPGEIETSLTGGMRSLLEGHHLHQHQMFSTTSKIGHSKERHVDEGREKFMTKLRLDPSLKPNDLHISVNSSNVVTIEGKMESRDETRGHHVSKTIKKQHTLPKNVDGESLKVSWLEEGNLLLEAPYKEHEPEHLSSPMQQLVVHRK